MTQVEIAVSVALPPDEAFAWLSSFERAPQWQSGVVEARPSRRRRRERADLLHQPMTSR